MTNKSSARELAVELYQNAVRAKTLMSANAWLGIYQVLLWYEPVNEGDIASLPHIIDADKLRSPRTRQGNPSTTVWQQRAQAVERYLARQLGCNANQVQERVDMLMRQPVYERVQRQNPLGIAFPVLIRYILHTYGNNRVDYELEVPAGEVFPGITVPGRSSSPRIDIVVRKENRIRAVLSCKWSLRHDRLSDISNECPAYKQAASWTRTQIDYIVVTNEYDPARLGKIIDDSCVDALVHVHKALPTDICGLNSRLTRMLDLSDLITRSRNW